MIATPQTERATSRARFIGGLASLLALSLRRPAAAQIAVFDAAGYANLIKQLSGQTVMTANQMTQIQNQLNLFYEVVNQRHLTIGQVWNMALPYIGQLASTTSKYLSLPPRAALLEEKFLNAFPDWQPGEPYNLIYEQAVAGQRTAIANSLRVAQMENDQLGNEEVTIASLASAKPATQFDMLSQANQIAIANVESMHAFRSTLAAQTESQSYYTAALIAKEDAARRAPAMAQLSAVLSDLPSQLQPTTTTTTTSP